MSSTTMILYLEAFADLNNTTKFFRNFDAYKLRVLFCIFIHSENYTLTNYVKYILSRKDKVIAMY